jgi:hypothetical protein
MLGPTVELALGFYAANMTIPGANEIKLNYILNGIDVMREEGRIMQAIRITAMAFSFHLECADADR